MNGECVAWEPGVIKGLPGNGTDAGAPTSWRATNTNVNQMCVERCMMLACNTNVSAAVHGLVLHYQKAAMPWTTSVQTALAGLKPVVLLKVGDTLVTGLR